MRTTTTTIPRFDSNERRANARSLCAVVVLLKGAPRTPLSARADKKISHMGNPSRNDYWIYNHTSDLFLPKIINEHKGEFLLSNQKNGGVEILISLPVNNEK